MKKLYVPTDESELAVIRSVLDSADIPYYIRNEYFGSLYIGPAMGSFNSKPIFVHEENYYEAKQILSDMIDEENFAPLDDEESPTFLDGIYNYIKNLF